MTPDARVLRFPSATGGMGAQDYGRFTRELSPDELAGCFSRPVSDEELASGARVHGDRLAPHTGADTRAHARRRRPFGWRWLDASLVARRAPTRPFQAGAAHAGGAIELYLPWPTFEAANPNALGTVTLRLQRPAPAAAAIAARWHPGWAQLAPAARSLHARNSHEILGAHLDAACASRFVLCWTPDASLDGSGRASGGTGQALRIAAGYRIAVFNLARPDHEQRIRRAPRAPTPTARLTFRRADLQRARRHPRDTLTTAQGPPIERLPRSGRASFGLSAAFRA